MCHQITWVVKNPCKITWLQLTLALKFSLLKNRSFKYISPCCISLCLVENSALHSKCSTRNHLARRKWKEHLADSCVQWLYAPNATMIVVVEKMNHNSAFYLLWKRETYNASESLKSDTPHVVDKLCSEKPKVTRLFIEKRK